MAALFLTTISSLTSPLFSATLPDMGYPGGKNGAGVFQRIISLMPPHRVYIEPFLGGGCVFRLKRPAEINIGIELDPGVAGRWIILPPEVTAGDSGGSGDARGPVFLASVATPGDSGGSGGARGPVFLASVSAAVGSGDSAGGIVVPGGARRVRRSPDLTAAAGDVGSGGGARGDLVGLAAVSTVGGIAGAGSAVLESGGARSRWEIRAGDGIDFLRRYPFRGDELVYCDPPYMMKTRSSGRLYACEMSDGAHRKLLKVLKRLPCMVMVSGYWSELYGRELGAWRSSQFESMTRGGMATETLWMNFPPALELHDYRYLGSNRREREQLKRQKARWVARLARMPELQRGALLSAVQEYASTVARNSGGARAVVV